MKKNTILLLLAIFAIKFNIYADNIYWQDVVKEKPATYNVDKATNTIEISTAEDLVYWANNMNSGDHIRLVSDIDMGAYLWNPLSYAWNIEIDGRGHRIKNLQVNTNSTAGMFTSVYYSTFKDIIFENVNVISNSSYTCAIAAYSAESIFINVGIEGGYVSGGDIVGVVCAMSGETTYTNCYVKNVTVVGNGQKALFVSNGGGNYRNCYAQGQIINNDPDSRGAGIMKYKLGGDVTRCYSIDTQMGVVGQNEGGTCSDTSSFYNNGAWTLRTPIVFDGVSCNSLLEALNNDVVSMNDSELYTWVPDPTSGLPMFGPKYSNPCPNVINLTAENIISNSTVCMVVSWEDYDAEQWNVKVLETNQTTITYQNTVYHKYDTIFGLELGKMYDIYVRPICLEGIGGWGYPVTILYDKPLWTSIVNSPPAGYVVDNNGNVTISTPEGLAWLAKQVITDFNDYSGIIVTLANDIDLSLYRWAPFGRNMNGVCFCGTLDGNGHVISNIYVNETDRISTGLIGDAENAVIKNIIMDGGTVKGVFYVGGLLGRAVNNCVVDNCRSSVEVYAGERCAGSLCGDFNYSSMKNCSSSGNVCSSESVGGLVGRMYGSSVINSYSTGNVNIDHSTSIDKRYRGGLVGYFAFSSATNCYSSGMVETGGTYTGSVIGCPDYNSHIHYVYGNVTLNPGMELIGYTCDDMSHYSKFNHTGNINTLLTPISINGVMQTDLLSALDAWVVYKNDHTIRTWALDNNTGFPKFADYFEPSCYNPMNLMASNATIVGETAIRTELSWTQIGDPDHWEVLYVASEHDISEGTVVSVNSNPCILENTPVGVPLDFYIRAICDGNDCSNWSEPISYIPDKLRWTDVVTSQPEGYYTDDNGNVYITNAEGLAWLSSVANGLNGVEYDPNFFNGKTIEIKSDINLDGYRWTPIGKDTYCRLGGAFFKGNNHTINGLYCNELEDFQGLIGFMIDGTIRDVVIKNCAVYGENYVGGVVGYASSVAGIDQVNPFLNSVDIINCEVEGIVCGIMSIGGIVGRHYGSDNIVANSCFIGSVIARDDITKVNTIRGYIGGLCGNVVDDNILNCYFVGTVLDETAAYVGILIGTNESYSVSNCYYKYYPTILDLTGDHKPTINCTSFSGSGNTWVLADPQFINGAYHSDLVETLNAWVDANNTGNIYNSWIGDISMNNGGYPLLNIINSPELYVIAASVNPSNGGYITGAGIYNYGDVATLTIHQYNGNQFENWTENGNVISEEPTISLTVTENRYLVANFRNTIGIAEVASSDLIVYPNPANEIIFIENTNDISICEIYNAIGRQMYRNDNCQQKVQINISEFVAGVYIIKIIAEDRVFTKKIVVK